MYCQSNLEDLFILISKIPNQQLVKGQYFDFIQTTNSVWPNLIFNLKVTKNNLDDVLDLMEYKISTNSIPNLLICSLSDKEHFIIDKLISRKYKFSEWTAMTHDLVFKKPTFQSELKIKLVDNTLQLQYWLNIVESELMNYNKLNPDIFNYLLEKNNCYFYLGFENNIPVATSFLFIEKNNAGIYLVSTLKTNRNKGFGTQMTHKCLEKAKALHCKKVDIQATALGYNIYKSLGFKTYGDITAFKIR